MRATGPAAASMITWIERACRRSCDTGQESAGWGCWRNFAGRPWSKPRHLQWAAPDPADRRPAIELWALPGQSHCQLSTQTTLELRLFAQSLDVPRGSEVMTSPALGPPRALTPARRRAISMQQAHSGRAPARVPGVGGTHRLVAPLLRRQRELPPPRAEGAGGDKPGTPAGAKSAGDQARGSLSVSELAGLNLKD